MNKKPQPNLVALAAYINKTTFKADVPVGTVAMPVIRTIREWLEEDFTRYETFVRSEDLATQWNVILERQRNKFRYDTSSVTRDVLESISAICREWSISLDATGPDSIRIKFCRGTMH